MLYRATIRVCVRECVRVCVRVQKPTSAGISSVLQGVWIRIVTDLGRTKV